MVLDDLEVGDFIIVTGPKKRFVNCAGIVGLPLKVVGIQLPFINTHLFNGQCMIINSRLMRIVNANEKYVESFLPQLSNHCWTNQFSGHSIKEFKE
jgi:hypothetical protein